VVILILAALFFLKLYRGFHSHRESSLIYKDSSSTVINLKRTKSKHRHSKPANPIRRIYYGKVNKHFKHHRLLHSDTPAEIQAKLADKEDLNEITQLYTKARYDKAT
jgi:hypothetical protein